MCPCPSFISSTGPVRDMCLCRLEFARIGSAGGPAFHVEGQSGSRGARCCAPGSQLTRATLRWLQHDRKQSCPDDLAMSRVFGSSCLQNLESILTRHDAMSPLTLRSGEDNSKCIRTWCLFAARAKPVSTKQVQRDPMGTSTGGLNTTGHRYHAYKVIQFTSQRA